MKTKVHFCWCGNYPDEDNEWKVLETPSEVANSPYAEVYYWSTGQCLEDLRNAIDPQLGIKFRDLMNRRHVLGACSEEDMPWLEDYLNAVQFLIDEDLFIMVKDLLSLVALHRSGGYFMDTTLKVAEETGVFKERFMVPSSLTPHSLKHALKNPPSGFRIPVVINKDNNKELQICGPSDDMDYHSLIEASGGKRSVPEIEVWCMYAPSRSKRSSSPQRNVAMSLDEAIERYLKRLRFINAALEDDHGTLQAIMNERRAKIFCEIVKEIVIDKIRDKDSPFKSFVGAQIVGAVYDGLFSTGYIGRDEVFTPQSKLPDWAWGAYRIKVDPVGPDGEPQSPPYSLPKVGVIKRYGGSWY